ncbi:MAG: CBS domain-containing protein [Humidesulfovibrio sp.]|uniref:CBS domain-containing protein n=1 Tax=Humidesulfovibrio sp. TaxID=2910988 RepID=UPI002735F96E|nr:CBS domain-containing protein [Humidesulfovibrio sp.]MDP2846835.1 CBS domain-containing protein [Humidesulfovibrio sp.]
MRIEQIMRHDPTRVGPDEPISRLIEWYANPGSRSRYTYVVDERGVLLGVVTMMEILGLFLEPEVVDSHESGTVSDDEAIRRISRTLKDRKDQPVSSLMRRDLPTVAPGGLFLDARLLLRERKITALPVVDADGVLVGEVTRRVLVKLLDSMLRDPDLHNLKKDCKRLFESAGSEFFVG